jgi:endogenous inhibitor of DNA gyrase (YacG/DUF329 family)
MAKSDTCAICGKPATADHAPFCSRGCRDRDLLQWLGEGYRLPAGPADPEESTSASHGLDSANDAD